MHDVLIDAGTTAALPAESLLIVDCRFALADPAQGEREFLAAHVPGAIHASLDRDLSDLSRIGIGRHPLPQSDAFAATLSRWGWRSGMRVVTYDAAGGALAAARLWWMLASAGIEASVLDGGWPAWRSAGLPIESGPAAPRPASQPEVRFNPATMVDYHELEALRAQPQALLLDARAAERFRGDVEPIDRVGGHVPGARNRPFAQNLTEDGRFKPPPVLRAEWDEMLDGRAPGDVVHMCGSGVTACHNLLAMEAAGLHGSRLFAPSWSGWISDPARPVATGSAA